MPCDAEDDEAVARDGAEGHDGDKEILETENGRIRKKYSSAQIEIVRGCVGAA